MGKVGVDLSMSLDGFIAGPNDSVDNSLGDGGELLFKWYTSGDTEYKLPSGDRTFKVSSQSAMRLKNAEKSIGVLVYGRRTFDIAHAWGGRHPMDLPMVIVTHHAPKEWLRTGSPFTFVTDGVESAIEQARKIAGAKNIAVGSASIAQQCINSRLLDEIHINLTPVLLGGGVRLFDQLGAAPIKLESTGVMAVPGVTHLDFRVVYK